MVLIDKLWDDIVAGPHPDRDLGRLRKIIIQPINIKDIEGRGKVMHHRSLTMPASAASHGTPITMTNPTNPTTPRKNNVWMSVFSPGSNFATKVRF